MNKLGIINYGMGNLTSIENALNYHNIQYEIINYYDIDLSHSFSGYILPGVGSFKKAMDIINEYKIEEYLKDEILIKKKPILGICLGMQLFFKSSTEEEHCNGLGFLNGNIIKFESSDCKIPHVGWNEIDHNGNSLFSNIDTNTDFYFDHSFYAEINNQYTISTTNYILNFTSSVNKENIYGVQFHPEKSQILGLNIFKNFAKICGVNNA
jgi:glutamine amidotransferase